MLAKARNGTVGTSVVAGGTKKDIVLLVISGAALLLSLFRVPLPFDPAWIAIVCCGIPIVLEAIIGLVTSFDIKADVLVSLALIASIGSEKYLPRGKSRLSCSLGPFWSSYRCQSQGGH